jgi:hypothetical protein
MASVHCAFLLSQEPCTRNERKVRSCDEPVARSRSSVVQRYMYRMSYIWSTCILFVVRSSASTFRTCWPRPSRQCQIRGHKPKPILMLLSLFPFVFTLIAVDRDISVAGRNLIGKWGPLLLLSRCVGAGKRAPALTALTPQRLVFYSNYRRCPLSLKLLGQSTPVHQQQTRPGPHARPIFWFLIVSIACPLASLCKATRRISTPQVPQSTRPGVWWSLI